MGTGAAPCGTTMMNHTLKRATITSALIATSLFWSPTLEAGLPKIQEQRNLPHTIAMGSTPREQKTVISRDESLEKILQNTEKCMKQLDLLERQISQPSWYKGFLGYLLGLGIGIGSLFGIDMLRRYRTATAYNKTGKTTLPMTRCTYQFSASRMP